MILEALSSHDYRVTWQRWAVAAHIALKGDELFTVEELFVSLREHYPDIGLTTVYRTLDLLVELGVIDRMHSADGLAQYSLRIEDLDSVQQLICEECGRVEEAGMEQMAPLLKGIAQQHGFHLLHFEGKMHGLCRQCYEAQDEEDPNGVEDRGRGGQGSQGVQGGQGG